VLEAKGRGYLDTGADPDAGYSGPRGANCDAGKLHELEAEFGRLESRAKARALEIVEEEWPAVRRVAEGLMSGMPLYSDYLDLLLAFGDNETK